LGAKYGHYHFWHTNTLRTKSNVACVSHGVAQQSLVHASFFAKPLIYLWWGRQDSNLRSHEAADLQSAPFATRDTPPLDGIAIRFAWRRRRIGHGEVEDRTTPFREARGRPRLWGKQHGKVNQGDRRKLQPYGSNWWDQIAGGTKLPLPGTHDTSLP
jgi:hypothetical protein